MDKNIVYRPNDEHDGHRAVYAVLNFPPLWKCFVFPDGQKVNIAYGSRVELPLMCMMVVVRPRPVFIGNTGKKTSEKACEVVTFPIRKEGLMPAVVLDDEHAGKKKSPYAGDDYGSNKRVVVYCCC